MKCPQDMPATVLLIDIIKPNTLRRMPMLLVVRLYFFLSAIMPTTTLTRLKGTATIGRNHQAIRLIIPSVIAAIAIANLHQ